MLYSPVCVLPPSFVPLLRFLFKFGSRNPNSRHAWLYSESHQRRLDCSLLFSLDGAAGEDLVGSGISGCS